MPKSAASKSLSGKKLARFIELVEQNPVLYNSCHPFNKDTSRKNLLWESIAEELDSQANLLKIQWKKLSTDYVHKSRETSEYDESLAFLLNRNEETGTSSLIENKENDRNSTSKELFGRELPAKKSSKGLRKIQFSPGPTPQNTPSNSTGISNARVLRPRRSDPTGSSDIRKSSAGGKRARGINGNYFSTDSSNDPDANSAFFESMALTVAVFPPHLQASVKMRICNLVNETQAQLSSPKIS